MATYTQDDIEASSKFADANNTIRILKKMYEKAPHLTSWLEVTVRDATNDDYYIPATLEHAAKIVTVNMTEDLCKLVSCNPMKEQDNCKPNQTASYYYVGDSDYDVQCQPACYNTAAKISYNENNERAVDTPQLNWNSIQNECRFVNSAMTSWLEKTFYRSDTKFERRVNDMPTGYTRIPSDNPYGCGYTYKTNKSYCKYYDRTLQDDGSCSMTLLEKLLDAIIGQTLINYVKSSIRMLSNDGIPFELPTNLPELPTELKTEHTLDGWKNNVNTSFVVPELIDTKPRLPTAQAFTTNIKNPNNDATKNTHDYRRQAELSSMDNMSNFMRTCIGLEPDTSKEKIFGVDKNGEILQPMGSSPKSRTKRSNNNDYDDKNNEMIRTDNDDDNDDDDDDTQKHWTQTMKDLFVSILEMFTKGDTYFYAGVDLTTQAALKKIKSIAVKIIEKMSTYLAKGLFDVTGSIGTKVLVSGIKGLSVKLITTMALRIGAKIAVMLAKILAAAASIIGWLLVGTMLLDMLFTFWDPYGYNNLYPPEVPNDMMESGELSLRQALDAPAANFKFENLAALVLSEDETMELYLESLVDRLIYLDALVVNSEGSRIDKGREINVNTGSKYEMESAQNAGLAQRVKFDLQNYEAYNDRFMVRVNVNKYLNYISASSVILSGVLMIAKLPILAMVAIIVALIVLAFSRLELQDDILVDLMDKYRNKTPQFGENNNGYSMD